MFCGTPGLNDLTHTLCVMNLKQSSADHKNKCSNLSGFMVAVGFEVSQSTETTVIDGASGQHILGICGSVVEF